jgi:gliding motility-associated-like protein
MKRFFYIISLFFLRQAVAQTYVTIPDANFSAYLNLIVPSAIIGNQLDTSNVLVTTTTKFINVSNKHIANLSGVQYFKSLTVLYCNNNQISTFPQLPISLINLNCGFNWLTNISALPCSLKIFTCDSNQLTSLPILPPSLRRLSCSGNQIANLPILPSKLNYLACSNNQLSNMPVLSDSLQSLYCVLNQLTNLPALPSPLKFLYCDNNKLNSLPTLPDSLYTFSCPNNNITCLPVLPNLIQNINLTGNPFNCLPNYIPIMNGDNRFYTAPPASNPIYPLCNVNNSGGCPISKDAPTQIIIPNIFTPNGDNINDSFFVKASNLTNFDCKIFDRWGLLIYEWNDVNAGWNGKDKSEGTYYYVITYSDNTKKSVSKNGFFQLIR